MGQVEFDSVMTLDLAKHLDKRIETVLRDFMDRCSECGVTYEDATLKAVTVLGHYFTVAALGAEATEDELVATCRWHYERGKANERPTHVTAGAGSHERRSVS